MSKEINNSKYREEVIKSLIKRLHAGESVDDVKADFQKAFDGVSGAEISRAEQALISEGLPIEEVQRLCDVHSAVFKETLESSPKAPNAAARSNAHPASVIIDENKAIKTLLETQLKDAVKTAESDYGKAKAQLLSALGTLTEIKKHYQRKENVIFPFLEKHGINGPPKVMWGVDDEIRANLKKAIAAASHSSSLTKELKDLIELVVTGVTEMIFKEENILIPMLEETLSDKEWQQIASDSFEIGFCLIPEPPAYTPQIICEPAKNVSLENAAQTGEYIFLPTGKLKLNELTALLNTLPIDITFVDKDDTVKYFSENAERVFPRTRSIIGRKVINCHPPASMHIVEQILKDFKDGVKNEESFWIKMGAKYIYIRYFAVKSESGEFLGTLEVTQDIAPIKLIDGEKRLLD